MSEDISIEAVAARLAAVREDLRRATEAAGREPGSVRLVAVSKRFPVEAIRAAAACGQRDFGENYVQEAVAKMEAFSSAGSAAVGSGVAETDPEAGLIWHMIGKVQSNKGALVGRRFDWVHGLDSWRAAKAIARGATESGRTVKVLFQIRLGGGEQRGGLEPEAAEDLAAEVASLDGLSLRGVMGVPVPDAPARPQFERLRLLGEGLAAYFEVPPADGVSDGRKTEIPMTEISAGMSGDYTDAIAEGSTMVRIGTAIFGQRSAGPQN